MSFLDQLDAAAGATTCDLLSAGGQSLIGYGAVTAAVGGGGLVPMGAGAIALLTKNLLCNPGWDPDTPQQSDVPGIDCSKAADGSPFDVYWDIPGISFSALILQNVVEITGIEKTPGQPEGSTLYNVNAIKAGGALDYGQFNADPGSVLRTTIAQGNCGGPPIAPPWVPPGPYTYTDPTTTCEFIVEFQDFVSLPDSSVQPVYKISPGAAGTLRNGGGIISGCNFSPVIYMGGPPGMPPYYGPWDPTWPSGPSGGTPPWLDFLNDLIGGLIGNAIYDALTAYFEKPYPASSRTIYAACEYKENGDPESFTVNFPEEDYQSRVLTALDAITDFQQQILYWKTPTCSGGGSSVSGEPVTITWSSDEPSPASGDRVRKIFTYFDQSGSSQLDHLNWWKDFSWQAGPVIVSCVGTALGRPQVWAASLDEAKRVIQHAATIAQVDLTKAKWMVSPPKSTRYGLPGTMRVHRSQDGGFWVTKRDGPDGAPVVLS